MEKDLSNLAVTLVCVTVFIMSTVQHDMDMARLIVHMYPARLPVTGWLHGT